MTDIHIAAVATTATRSPIGARQRSIDQVQTCHLPLSQWCNSSSPVKESDVLPVQTPGARVVPYLEQNKREPAAACFAPEHLEEGTADAE